MPRRGPWQAKAVAGTSARDAPLLSEGRSLYARGDNNVLVRIDAATGHVRARQPATVVGTLTRALIVADTLWLTPSASPSGLVSLRGFNPTSLAPRAPIRVRFDGATNLLPAVPIAAAPHGHLLYLALDHTVDVIDAAKRHLVERFAVSRGYLLDLALSPDGQRLYLAVHDAAMTARIEVRDARSGALIRTREHAGNIVNNTGLLASSGGLWLLTGGGMSDSVGFLNTALQPDTHQRGTYAGGRPITVTTGGGAVWVGASNIITCADPTTGRVRDTAQLPPQHGSTATLIDMQYAAGHLFGYYQAGGAPGVLVQMTPPSRCLR